LRLFKTSPVVAKKHLDYILSSAKPNARLSERIEWLANLLAWIRQEAEVAEAKQATGRDPDSLGRLQNTKIRFVLQVLQRHEDWRTQVAKTIRSVIKDTDALELFSHLGLPGDSGLMHEIVDRVMLKSLPLPPGEDDLGEFFGSLFPVLEDANWIEKLDDESFEEILALLAHSLGEDEQDWNTLPRDMEEALMVLVGQVETTGVSFSIRRRLSSRRMQEIPFYQLSRITHGLIENFGADDFIAIRQKLNEYHQILDRCREEIQYAYTHLSDWGVSLHIVYQLDRLEAQISRVATLLDLLVGDGRNSKSIKKFWANLIRESYERHHVLPLLTETVSILSRRIVERHAESGESYITRNAKEYRQMLRKAGGGGFFTALTVTVKELLYHVSASGFWHGLMASTNYALSFVAIQFGHYTLATKQPAMTAPALAAKMHNLYDQENLAALVKEIIFLIRSQVAAVLGNVALVVPAALAICVLINYGSGAPMMDAARARAVIADFSILGMTPLFAAITGVLLWTSSLIAGLVDNWLAYRQVPAAVASSRRLGAWLGRERAEAWGQFLGKHGTGIAGNVSLGFLLGMLPQIAAFFGIGFDVRHVTLASGNLAMAMYTLATEVGFDLAFWLAALGVAMTGFLNVSVSFGFALIVAMNARRISSFNRQRLYKAMVKTVFRNPLAVFFPVGRIPKP